jgi:hypothetical protein
MSWADTDLSNPYHPRSGALFIAAGPGRLTRRGEFSWQHHCVTPAQLADAVRAAAAAALRDLGLDPSVLPEVVSVQRPRQPEHGDYASALALQVARKAGVPPRELAQAIAGKLGEDPAIQSVAIAGPGS